MDIFEYLLSLVLSTIGVIYYAVYSVCYGLYNCFYDVVQPLLEAWTNIIQIVVDPILMSTVVLGVFPPEVVVLMIALCTCKICILFARLILRILGTLPTLSGGFFEFK